MTEGAQWPLSRKFGCTPEMAVELLEAAGKAGLDPYGISFHVGSQQTDPEQWDGAIGRTAAMFRALAERNIALRMINLGGGLPARYRDGIAPVDAYGAAMMASVIRHFGNDIPDIIIEPGRGMVGEAGILQSEVVLIADKGGKDRRRWVYLDVGRFNGLAETMGEAIQYEIRTPHDRQSGRARHPRRSHLRQRRCHLRGKRLSPARRSGDRRQGRVPGDRRVYLDLRIGLLQRLRAAQDLLRLSDPRPGLPGRRYHRIRVNRSGTPHGLPEQARST